LAPARFGAGQELQQFEEMCPYHQTSPLSHFTQGKICTIATAEGRKRLTWGKFMQSSRDGRERETVIDEARFLDLLEKEFGIRG
jgi:N-hydroxyarylamine O-acetyltransferase